MYQTILVPLDGSKRAEAILPHVEQLAAGGETEIILLEVITPSVSLVDDFGGYIEQAVDEVRSRSEAAERYLKSLSGELRQKGVAGKTRVELASDIVQTILAVAEDEDADLIAMSSHGRTGLARAFYGSVAAGVLHRTDRPLLLVRAEDNRSPQR